jgi:hypothetical protein
LGLSVTPDELQERIELDFGYQRNPPTPTPTPIVTPPLTPTEELEPTPDITPYPTPTPMTEDAFRQLYNDTIQSLRSMGIPEGQFRAWIEASLLLEELREVMDEQVPTEGDQVELHYVNVDSQEWANEMVARLDAGEEFEVIATELEESEEVEGFDSETGWSTRSALEDRFTPEWGEVAFGLEIGDHSHVISDTTGNRFYVFQVLGHEVRELESYALQQAQDKAFEEWLEAQKQALLVEYPPIKTECRGETSAREEACSGSWRDRDPTVCAWAFLRPCGGSWRDRVPIDP